MPLFKSHKQREEAALREPDIRHGHGTGIQGRDAALEGQSLPPRAAGPGQANLDARTGRQHGGVPDQAIGSHPNNNTIGYNDQYNNTDQPTVGTYGAHDSTGFPQGTSHSTGTTGQGGKGQRMTGKVESALGSALGSESLRAKGIEKQREANIVSQQGLELQEAEALEREAIKHREQAVAHGAHPDNLRPTGGGGLPTL